MPSEQAKSLVTRASVVHVMGLTGDRRSIEFLARMARESSNQVDLVRAFATYSLGMLCDRRREPTVALYSRNHNYTLDLPVVGELFYLF